MDKLSSFIDSNVIYALGWTLLHSVWQCLLVYALLLLSLKLTLSYWASMRYVQSLSAMMACVLISLLTFSENYHNIVQASAQFTSSSPAIPFQYGSSWWTSVFTAVNPWLQGIVVVWFIGLIIQMSRYIQDFVNAQRLKQQASHKLINDWPQRLMVLARRMGIKHKVNFKVSAEVTIPCVIGYIKPTVLLPLSLFTKVPVEQIEAIVLHELAHIRRADYLVNLLQCVVKAGFFFNPFLLLISHKIDQEREHACDDLAVAVCGNPLVFAHSLSRFAEVARDSKIAMAASKDRFFLLARVNRLFDKRTHVSGSTERFVAVLSMLLMEFVINISVAKESPVGEVKSGAVAQVPDISSADTMNQSANYSDEDFVPMRENVVVTEARKTPISADEFQPPQPPVFEARAREVNTSSERQVVAYQSEPVGKKPLIEPNKT